METRGEQLTPLTTASRHPERQRRARHAEHPSIGAFESTL